MSRRQDIQTAEGVALEYRGYGVLQYFSKNLPAGGEVGFAAGAIWGVLGATATTNQNLQFMNVGSNGFGTNARALWVENDSSAGNAIVFGGGSATMLVSGNIYRRILTVAQGISPSATALDKIVDAFTVPASSFDIAGRGLQVTVWGTAAANANNKNFKVILGATNVSTVAINGTVTVTGGTTIGNTGTLTTNNGGLMLTCQIFKNGAAGSNTQQSMTTAIVGGGTHAGIGTWTDQTFTEANALLLVVTAQSTTLATDIVYQGCEITAFN